MSQPSNKRIARQKKAQAGFSLVGGTLGLAALGSRGKASQLTRSAAKLPRETVFKPHARAAKQVKPNEARTKLEAGASKWKDRSTALTTAGAGVGGVGAYNFASYTNADAKKQQKLKKNHDPFELSKKKDRDVAAGATAGAIIGGSRGIRPGISAAKKDNALHLKLNRIDVKAGRKPQYGQLRRTFRAGKAVGNPVATAALGGAAVGAAASYAYKKVKKADATSAFGIDHGY